MTVKRVALLQRSAQSTTKLTLWRDLSAQSDTDDPVA